MAAIEPSRKRLTSFTIESIVGRRSPRSPRPSPPPVSCHVDDRSPVRSPTRKSTQESGSGSASSSSGAEVTSAGQHLELLARFATPNLRGNSDPVLTRGTLGRGNTGTLALTEALIRASHLPYAAVELENLGNGFTSPAAAMSVPTVDGSGTAALTLLCGRDASMWNPHDPTRRVSPQRWPVSLVHPLTTGVRPAADPANMHHPYFGKYSMHMSMTSWQLNVLFQMQEEQVYIWTSSTWLL